MAATWMRGKLAKMKASRAPFDPSTTLNRPGHTVEAHNALARDTAVQLQQFNGVITVCPPGRAYGAYKSKGAGFYAAQRREIASGTTARGSMKSILSPDVYYTGPARLIPNKNGHK